MIRGKNMPKLDYMRAGFHSLPPNEVTLPLMTLLGTPSLLDTLVPSFSHPEKWFLWMFIPPIWKIAGVDPSPVWKQLCGQGTPPFFSWTFHGSTVICILNGDFIWHNISHCLAKDWEYQVAGAAMESQIAGHCLPKTMFD